MVDQVMVDRLAALIKSALQSEQGQRPNLTVVGGQEPPKREYLDSVTRESYVRMIGHLRRRYGLQMLVDQAIFGKGSVDRLGDEELEALYKDLERARECIADGISFEDAGLLRSRYG
jgi:hypothetical protein